MPSAQDTFAWAAVFRHRKGERVRLRVEHGAGFEVNLLTRGKQAGPELCLMRTTFLGGISRRSGQEIGVDFVPDLAWELEERT